MGLCLCGDLLFHQRRHHIGGADSVTGNAQRAALHTGGFGEADQAVLGRNISAFEFRGHQTVDGAHVDNTTPALFLHVGPAIAGQQEGCRQHQADDEVPLILGELLDGADMLNTRHIGQNIHAAALRYGEIHQLATVLALCQIAHKGNTADFTGSLGKQGLINVGHHHLCAFFAQRLCNSIADTAGGTGNNSNLIL